MNLKKENRACNLPVTKSFFVSTGDIWLASAEYDTSVGVWMLLPVKVKENWLSMENTGQW